MKTIKMPRALATSWIAALRSGDYEQGAGKMQKSGKHNSFAYCCLGVLQMTVDGKVETDSTGHPLNLPSSHWLRSHDITFIFDGKCCGGDIRNPYLPAFALGAAQANDMHSYNFSKIADAIEDCVEFTDDPAPGSLYDPAEEARREEEHTETEL